MKMRRSTFLLLALALLAPRAARAQETPAAPAEIPGVLELSEVEVLPVPKNFAEAERLLEQLYPKALREGGVEGTARVRFVLSALGTTTAARVVESAGHPGLDSAALGMVAALRFDPARRGGAAVPVWVTLPVRFVAVPPRVVEGGGPDSLGIYRMEQVDVLPELQNRLDVARDIGRQYPDQLLRRGEGGTARVELVIDREGNVSGVTVVETSHPAVGAAAGRVAAKMRFSPARLNGEAVPVRAVFPVTFNTMGGARIETREIPSTPSWLPADVRPVPFPRTTEGTRGNP